MDEQTIDALAAAIAKAIFTYIVPVHDYDDGTDKRVPYETHQAYELAELSQIRLDLTGR